MLFRSNNIASDSESDSDLVNELTIEPIGISELIPEPSIIIDTPEPTPEPTANYEIQGVVTTVAGNNLFGHVNAIGTDATFQGPTGLVIDTNGTIYVADSLNSCIRKITPDGEVSDFATSIQFNRPESLAIDTSGILYAIDTKNNIIYKISQGGQVTPFVGSGKQGSSDGEGTNAEFYFPGGITIDSTTNTLYVADAQNHTIRMINPDGIVSTFAGSGVSGFADGMGRDSQFSYPTGITIDNTSGVLYVADRGNARIRKILPSGYVTTLAGSGFSIIPQDGLGTAASFRTPSGITIDTHGTLYVTDSANNIIRKITPEGLVTTIAGKPDIRHEVFANGVGTAASFRSPYGISFDTTNNILYVTDSGNNRIRKIV